MEDSPAEAGAWQLGRGGTIAWAVRYHDEGEPMPDLLDCHEVWFSAELLAFPRWGWSVDWSGSCLAMADQVLPKAIAKGHTPTGEVMEGVIVKHKDPQRVWVLTKEWSFRSNGYKGVWPD